MNIPTPHTIDLNINRICNLNCPWCWWPEHSKSIESFHDEEWVELINFLTESWTESFIFTGWEPLLKSSLRKLLKTSFDLWNRNTLSTNGILLSVNRDVLELVHDVGIPLDWPTVEINQLMRVWSPIHFDRALWAMKLIQEKYPHIDLTIRTVASAKNKSTIPDIWRVLIENDINPENIRWKVYQCSTSGPRRGTTFSDGWLVTDGEFRDLETLVRIQNPQYPKITFQPLAKTIGTRYFLIMPNGDLKVVQNDSQWFPVEIVIGRLHNGDIRENFMRIIHANPDLFLTLKNNNTHG